MNDKVTPDFRLSCEFFAPRTQQGMQTLERVVKRLEELSPDFYSCTYGAGGSTRDGTHETISRLMVLGLQAAPHLSIGGDSKEVVCKLLDDYRTMGVRRIVALRGDLPSGIGTARFGHNAESLVAWIREHSGQHFALEVAAYPDAQSPADDIAFFQRKIAAGAGSAITQYFYNPHAYYDFTERCAKAGITVPLHVGIMPITNFEGIVRFSKNCGADIPRWLFKRLESLQDDHKGLREFGVEVLTRLCEELISFGIPGLHFYTLNRWGATLAICKNLGLDQRDR
jgi:methylenetetrahydrofolate reductase (NADPH)